MKMLRILRKANGLTQKDLAAMVGVAANTISQYESGKNQATYEMQLRLAEALDTSVDYLLTGSLSPSSPIGTRINQRRQVLGISAEDLAAKVGCSPATIYRYENGDISSMRVDRLPLIASALGVSESWLAGWDTIRSDDDQLLAAYHAAPEEIRDIVNAALSRYRKVADA